VFITSSNIKNIKLQSVDDLFKSEEGRADEKREKVTDIPLSDLYPFKNHPFQVNDNEELRELAKSIAENGMVTPAIARPRQEGGYELVAGHRRKAACEIAGIEVMPVLVREMDDDTATIVMVDSNQQRENLLPSEKAFSYKMKLEAMKRQAGRPSKNNSAQVGLNFSGKQSSDILGVEVGESRNQIQRYIRLTNLIPGLLKMVDEKCIAFNPAVELSYLPEEAQKKLLGIMDMQQSTLSLSQAQQMKQLSAEGKLNEDIMLQFLSGEKPNQKEKLSIKRDRVEKYFPKDYSAKQMEDTILKLLEDWQRKRQREREQPSR
jgi:ParB family chromosome partitioning protein